jgi:hypothetical protein
MNDENYRLAVNAVTRKWKTERIVQLLKISEEDGNVHAEGSSKIIKDRFTCRRNFISSTKSGF